MAINFVAIDFETANRNSASACSVGLVRVREGAITDEYYSLIKPPSGLDEFAGYNIGIHGITPEIVKDAPVFGEIWPGLSEFIGQDILVAHNATFDMDVLRECLKLYGIPPVTFQFTCTYKMSQQLLDLLNYKLPTVHQELVQGTINHHDALADAKASAQIAVALCNKFGVSEIDEILEKANLNYGEFDSSASKGFNVMRRGRAVSYKRAEIDKMQSQAAEADLDPNHPCFGLEFVFTGTLGSMDRQTAQDSVVAVGGRTGSSVTRSTNILVEGTQDPRQLVPGATHSRAYEKAMIQKEKRSDIEVIDEVTFLGMLNG